MTWTKRKGFLLFYRFTNYKFYRFRKNFHSFNTYTGLFKRKKKKTFDTWTKKKITIHLVCHLEPPPPQFNSSTEQNWERCLRNHSLRILLLKVRQEYRWKGMVSLCHIYMYTRHIHTFLTYTQVYNYTCIRVTLHTFH